MTSPGRQEPASPRFRRRPPGAILAAGALPILLLHVDYQPSVTVGSVGIQLSDLAVLAVVVAALGTRSGLRSRLAPLYPLAALCAWIGIEVVLPVVAGRAYDTGTHLVAAAGFAEYALLAAALPLLVRERDDVRLLLRSLVLTATAAAAVGLVQFVGVGWLTTFPAWHRQPSFVGYHDLAALGGVTLALALASLALDRPRDRWRALGLAAGSICLALSGSVGGGLGLALAAALVLVVAGRLRALDLRRLGAGTAIVLATLGAIVVVRGGDLDQALRFAGLRAEQQTTVEDVQTYSHRTLLAWLGWQVFLDRPAAGAGWHATEQYDTLEPYLEGAHRRFPDVADQAFPTRATPYGIQNAWIQALADLGLIGFLLFAAALLVPAGYGARAALAGRPEPAVALGAAAALVATTGVWAAQGLVAALPLDALTWTAVGLVVCSLRRMPEDRPS